MLDFLKTFANLEYYGFDKCPKNIFSDYSSFRPQKVILLDSFSDLSYIVSGCSKSSILGPLLSTIHTPNMFKVAELSHIQVYADDTQIYFTLTRHQLYIWTPIGTESCLKHNLNPEKTVAIVLSEKKDLEISIFINNDPRAFSSHCKLLRVLIYDISQKCYLKLRMLYSNLFIINFRIWKTVAESFILPIIFLRIS